jgi:thioredoxin reductase
MSDIASSVDWIIPPARGETESPVPEALRESSTVTIFEGAKVIEIAGDAAGVSGVRIAKDDGEHMRPARGVFLEVGLLPASMLAIDLGVSVDEDQFIEVGIGQGTNVPGIYAAGDITGHRARQTVISAGEGATAAVAAVDYIKANNLGGDRKALKLIQWGTTPSSPPAKEEPDAGGGFVEA